MNRRSGMVEIDDCVSELASAGKKFHGFVPNTLTWLQANHPELIDAPRSGAG